ncbi:hypothetical protein AAV94_04865 [Lampropedia cohaerens]|uniref:Glycosyltransferase n=1 Tax=Lampropedia cohaerens TaxID=1610491 RepID=A0A0U1Q1A4_9BURK|nr:hypothetical protein AAV94_04865 [Lampropedia cohaerens]
MNRPPSPAIVTQAAVRALPRPLLWLLCLVYVCAGFIGRSAWKNEDVIAYGFMQAIARGDSPWLTPQLVGQPLEFASQRLPIWLGALALRILPPWLDPELATRLPFMLLVLASFVATWYAAYYLARRHEAQPVPFAFGGEARPVDYARALADGAVLALIACLGLIQFSHETTASVVQLSGASVLFLALSVPHRPLLALLWATVAVALLYLSGGALWTLIALCAATLALLCSHPDAPLGHGLPHATVPQEATGRAHARLWLPLVLLAAAALMATTLWHEGAWPLAVPRYAADEWKSIVRLLIWFGWPAWPLGCWALYRWRRHLFNRRPAYHLALPVALIAVTVALAVCLEGSRRDRTLFLSLPMAATLAAFALPTLSRSVAALIDWFTLLFFTVCGVAIWVIWTATQTGFPAKPAANVAKLAPEYVPQFSLLAFVLALAATAVWLMAIAWRTGRHRAALWKSLVLPAGGATWCVVLVMTLWLPMLDYGRSYLPLIDKLREHVPARTSCIVDLGLLQPQLAAFYSQAGWPMHAESSEMARTCPLAMLTAVRWQQREGELHAAGWSERARVQRPTGDEAIVILSHPTR